jgi:hypothetical protein
LYDINIEIIKRSSTYIVSCLLYTCSYVYRERREMEKIQPSATCFTSNKTSSTPVFVFHWDGVELAKAQRARPAGRASMGARARLKPQARPLGGGMHGGRCSTKAMA